MGSTCTVASASGICTSYIYVLEEALCAARQLPFLLLAIRGPRQYVSYLNYQYLVIRPLCSGPSLHQVLPPWQKEPALLQEPAPQAPLGQVSTCGTLKTAACDQGNGGEIFVFGSLVRHPHKHVRAAQKLSCPPNRPDLIRRGHPAEAWLFVSRHDLPAQTVSRALPLSLLRFRTLRPALVFILLRKPCSLFLLRTLG